MKEVSRLEKILNDLLNYTRDESLVFKELDLRDILEESLSMISEGIRCGGIQLVKEFAEEVPKVIGDYLSIKTGLLQSDQQRLSGHERREGRFPSESIPFQRMVLLLSGWKWRIPERGLILKTFTISSTPSIRQKISRLGLGLPIVHKIITSHRGQIEVDNHPGKGVTFIITLPARERK